MKECDVIKQEPWGLPTIIAAIISTLISIAATVKIFNPVVSSIVGLVIIALWGWILYGNCKFVYTRLVLYTDRIEANYKDSKQKADKYDDFILAQTAKFEVAQSNQSIQENAQPIKEADAPKDHTQSRIE
ncbi:hypothetical protein [Lactiplantibacillus paraxiangfangensis]|uniref:hypothetical protein n=1 Tax=Lactiplantibacillus paraxiangfangensis TaxID=3076224 RepID=UPI0030C75014